MPILRNVNCDDYIGLDKYTYGIGFVLSEDNMNAALEGVGLAWAIHIVGILSSE